MKHLYQQISSGLSALVLSAGCAAATPCPTEEPHSARPTVMVRGRYEGKPASFVFKDNRGAGYDQLSICDPEVHRQAPIVHDAIKACVAGAHTTIKEDYALVTAAYQAVSRDALRAIAPEVKR